MARKVTSKRPNSAKNVSHAHNKTNKKQNLNFQYVTINGIKFKTMCQEKQIKLKFTEKKKMMHVYPILPVKEAKEALKDILEIINEN